MRPHLGPLLGACCVALSLACGGYSPAPEPASQALAENGTDVADIASRAAAMTASFALGQASHLKFASSARQAGSFYAPNECIVTTETSPTDVTASFNDCNGPWGLTGLSGPVVMQLSNDQPASGEELQLTAGGHGPVFTVGGAQVSFSANAIITYSGLERQMTFGGTLSGTTARGRSFTSNGSWTLRWVLGGTCLTISGSSKDVVNGSHLSTTVQGLQLCDAACPTSGSVAVEDDTNADTVSVTFTGMDVANFVAGGGNNSIQLACGL